MKHLDLGFATLAAAVLGLVLDVPDVAAALALATFAGATFEAWRAAVDVAAGRRLARILRAASTSLDPSGASSSTGTPPPSATSPPSLPRGLTPRIASYTPPSPSRAPRLPGSPRAGRSAP